MGGIGSGRPAGSGRPLVESHLAIDANRLQSRGCFAEGWSGEVVQGVNGSLDGFVLRIDPGFCIRVVRVPCALGGVRHFFCCPSCSKQTAALFFSDDRLRCRFCLGLAYESQILGTAQRNLRKAYRLAAASRRKGLWGRTIAKLERKAQAAESEALRHAQYDAHLTLVRLQAAASRTTNLPVNDPVVALALFANDPTIDVRLRIVAHATIAKHIYERVV